MHVTDVLLVSETDCELGIDAIKFALTLSSVSFEPEALSSVVCYLNLLLAK